MRQKKLIALALAIAIAIVMTGIALAATVLIDHFETGPQFVVSTVPCAGCSATSSESVTGTSILGGERDLVVTATGIPGGGTNFANRVQVNTAGDGVLAMSSDGGVEGEMLVVWDGVDNDPNVISTTGLNGIDLTGGGTNGGFIVRTTFDDLPVSATLRVYSNTDTAQTSFDIPGDINTTFVDFFIPFTQFTGTTSVLNNAGAIAFYINGRNSPGADVYFHLLELTSTLEFGDLPEDATHHYSTTLANDGARHEPRTGLRLGAKLDAEINGQPSLSATGDNVTSADTVDDEDGVTRGHSLAYDSGDSTDPNWRPGTVIGDLAGGGVNVTIAGSCSTARPCFLRGWIDWNSDGILEPSEVIITGTSLSNPNNFGRITAIGTSQKYFDIPQPGGPGTSPACFGGTCYARFRLCGGPNGAQDCNQPFGLSTTGEVEDYAWAFTPTAITLTSLQAQLSTSPLVPVVLVGMSALVLIGVVFTVRRRRRKTA